MLANPDNLVFMAGDDSVPVGYAYAEVMRTPETPLVYANDRVYLHHIGVRPTTAAKRGRRLLAAVARPQRRSDRRRYARRLDFQRRGARIFRASRLYVTTKMWR